MSHRRRGVGVGGRGGRGGKGRTFQKKADEMKAISYQSAIDTIERLETKLSTFAKQHSNEIKNDPAIRQKFLLMCGPLGIDPLLSSSDGHKSKNFSSGSIWNSLFFGGDTNNSDSSGSGNMGDFYYELAVQIAEICLASRSRNGGIMSITEIQTKLSSKKTRFHLLEQRNTTMPSNDENPKYSIADIQMAISKLGKLGGGFRVIEIGGDDNDDDNGPNFNYVDNNENTTTASKNNNSNKLKDFINKYKSKHSNSRNKTNNKTYMVISVPIEFDNDHMELLSLVKEIYTQGITVEQIKEATGWNKERIERSLQLLLSKGMIWLDRYQGIDNYWFPSLWQEETQQQQ